MYGQNFYQPYNQAGPNRGYRQPPARGYCRVSTTYQSEDGVSLDTQKKRIQDHCLYKGLNLIKIYEDGGISAKDMNRPALQLLFQEIQPGDHVIITDLSRMSRNTSDALRILEYFKSKGVIFVCLNPEIDFSNHIGELIFTILMAVHRLERQNISSHVTNNMRMLSKEGKLRSRPPFGWRFVGKDKDYEKDPAQQAVLDKIKIMFINGMKYKQIADKLNEDGDNACLLNNRRKKNINPRFHAETIKCILIDHGMVEPKPGDKKRLSIQQRIKCRHQIDKEIEESMSNQPEESSEQTANFSEEVQNILKSDLVKEELANQQISPGPSPSGPKPQYQPPNPNPNYYPPQEYYQSQQSQQQQQPQHQQQQQPPGPNPNYYPPQPLQSMQQQIPPQLIQQQIPPQLIQQQIPPQLTSQPTSQPNYYPQNNQSQPPGPNTSYYPPTNQSQPPGPNTGYYPANSQQQYQQQQLPLPQQQPQQQPLSQQQQPQQPLPPPGPSYYPPSNSQQQQLQSQPNYYPPQQYQPYAAPAPTVTYDKI